MMSANPARRLTPKSLRRTMAVDSAGVMVKGLTLRDARSPSSLNIVAPSFDPFSGTRKSKAPVPMPELVRTGFMGDR